MDKNAIVLVSSCLGVAQALFLCIYLLTLQTGNRKANQFLALAILGITIRVGKSILNVYLDLDPWQRNLGLSGILLTGPFLWFYGKILLEEGKNHYKGIYWHLIPFALMVFGCYFIPNDGSTVAYAIYLLVFLHLAIYLVSSFVWVHKFRGEAHPQKIKWFRNLSLGIALVWIFYMGNLAGVFSLYIGGAIFFSLLIYIFSFLFLQKHAFRLGKYNTSTLDKSSSQQLMEKTKKLFLDESLFLDNSISLETAAEKLKVPPRKLSQAINENEQKNFSEFVNGYRIEKAKSLLISPKYQKEKIASIAYDCGFGNVTSFNLAFKSKTQLTPSEYRKKFGST
ncbi:MULTISPECIES: helix-turn-helix domain-containing protein [Flavobacteriaceae]|uniref:helix-turn-helix domain-containing protein n=1 Tax=Flavobacteriaceae TaxID=49546 RepID=UPI001490D8C9|nr:MULTISPECIES: helix-turn-helix domain-containing protein [Allomuricauda]MDC6366356.1 helix-turn-helix domain-containing protein [Muricauda sp. AC10]